MPSDVSRAAPFELDDDSVGGSREVSRGSIASRSIGADHRVVEPAVRHTGPVDADHSRKLAALRTELRRLGRVVVAFSGGADSAFLAAVAHRTLGRDAVHAVTAVSPSLAGAERDDCRALAAEWGLRWTPVETDEMERAAYRINDTDRCFHCKAELMDVVGPDRRGRAAHRRARRQRRRPRRPPARASGRPARAVPRSRSSPPGSPRPTCARRRGAGPAHVGQAGGGVPGEPRPVRDAR